MRRQKAARMMSIIPSTKTHAVSLAQIRDVEESMGKRTLDQLKNPIQRVLNRGGSDNPQDWQYGPNFYDLGKLIKFVNHPKAKINLSDFDDVQWDDIHPLHNPSAYEHNTPLKLQQAIQNQERFRQRQEIMEQYNREMQVRQAALKRQMENELQIMRERAKTATSASEPRYNTSRYSRDPDVNRLADIMQDMNLAHRIKRPFNYDESAGQPMSSTDSNSRKRMSPWQSAGEIPPQEKPVTDNFF